MRNLAITPEQFTNFGELLRFLRKRAGTTQRELSIAVGYSDSQISRLEQNQRIPDEATILAVFIPALGLEKESDWSSRLVDLAASARSDRIVASDTGRRNHSRYHLPLRMASFIGRKDELDQIVRLLSRQQERNRSERTAQRLITLTGPGGIGKTSLAIQVAIRMDEVFPDEVWWIDLAALSDPELVASAVMGSLGLEEVAGKSAIKTLVDHLSQNSALLILDNCEHLITACAQFAETILISCPHVWILATSREAFEIMGEITIGVPPLSLPDPRYNADIDELSRYELVCLFTERAQAVLAGFDLTEENAPYIVQVCRRLDGVPLAIELAAARVKVLSVAQLNKRLDDVFHALSGGNRTALPRQQTLQATIDWSYNLLSAKERLLLNRLSIFPSEWCIEAAEEICADNNLIEF